MNRSFAPRVFGPLLALSCGAVPAASTPAQLEPPGVGAPPQAPSAWADASRESSEEGTVWHVAPEQVGGLAPRVIGQPRAEVGPLGSATCFNGKSDGLVLERNPLAGWREFTLQVLFRPDADGPAEQRFVHLQESGTESRAMVETRVTPDGHWYLDTFLRSPDDKLALIDPQLRHPADRWYWAALTYDGQTMRAYVDGQLEGQGAVRFPPLSAGRTSLGVRLNEVHWFQGCIAELRFDPAALPPGQLAVLPEASRE